MSTDDMGAVLDALNETRSGWRERERLGIECESFARLCVKAVNEGDFAAAVDWAEEYALTDGKLRLLLGISDGTGGDEA